MKWGPVKKLINKKGIKPQYSLPYANYPKPLKPLDCMACWHMPHSVATVEFLGKHLISIILFRKAVDNVSYGSMFKRDHIRTLKFLIQGASHRLILSGCDGDI
jgi:hypothetical protein